MDETTKKKRRITPTQRQHVKKYVSTHYDRFEMTVPKGYKELLKAAADAADMSLTRYLFKAGCEKAGIEAPPLRTPTGEIVEEP